MSFFDELKKGFSDVSEVIVKKSNEMMEIQKLKLKKSSMESDIKKDYMLLGKLYFNQMEKSGTIDEAAEDAFQRIVEGREAIKEINIKIQKMSKERTCSVCGEKSSKAVPFCPFCGAKFDDEDETPEFDEEDETSEYVDEDEAEESEYVDDEVTEDDFEEDFDTEILDEDIDVEEVTEETDTEDTEENK